MVLKKREWIPYVLALLALVVGACYDYQIDAFLYNPHSIFGNVFERIVLIPIEYIVILTMCMLYRKYRNPLFILLEIIAAVYVVLDSAQYWVAVRETWMLLSVIALVCIVITHAIVKRIPMAFIQKQLTFFIFFTCVLLTATLLTTILKELWGRVRFRDLQDIQEFCAWYAPRPIRGNSSFPSGHTTAFTSILCVLQWKLNAHRKNHIGMYVLLSVLILLMPLSRMIVGAHYVSDTAMGFMIAYSCYLGYRQMFRRGGRI